jgi:hypothetical protein
LLFPVFLDVFLWLGPRLSISPLTQSLIEFVQTLRSPDDSTAQSIQAMVEVLKLIGERTNVFSFLSTSPLGVPSMMDVEILANNPVGQPLVLGIDNGLVFITIAIALMFAGLLFGTTYFVSIGAQFDERKLTFVELLKRVMVIWARVTTLAILAVIVIAVLVFVFVFFVTVVQVLALVMSSVAPVVSGAGLIVAAISQALLSILVLWMVLFLIFTIHGMVLKNRGVLSSIWDSIRLVQWNLLSVVGLLILIYVINLGMRYLWSLPSPDSWLTLAGIAGHAFISTGLIAATFVFYKDRYRWWTEMREWMLTQRGRGKPVEK